MNQQQFIKTGQGKALPITLLKWIWKNIDKLDAILEVIKMLKKAKENTANTLGDDDGGLHPKPPKIDDPTEPNP